jgi:M6 family metalloprotease-like protein
MSSGSWLSHGKDTIGTTPNHMVAWEKLQLGWLHCATVAHDQSATLMLGPAMHATKKEQALIVTLPKDANGKTASPSLRTGSTLGTTRPCRPVRTTSAG